MHKGFIVNNIGVNITYKTAGKIKITHISDLHNSFFGPHNRELARAVDDSEPDIIVFTGDMIDDPADGAPFIELVDNINSECHMYMCLGNHEIRYRRKEPDKFERIIKELSSRGVIFLDDDCDKINIRGTDICVYGLATACSGHTASSQSIMRRMGECSDSAINIVLAHDPAWFNALAAWGADMVFSGHIHGGLLRLPVLGGLIAPGYRILPKYDAGLFVYNNRARMYLSSGLGGCLDRFRYKNPHELALVHINDEDFPEEKTRRRVATDIKFSFKILLTFIMILTTLFSFVPISLGYIDINIIINLILGVLGIICIYPPGVIANSRRIMINAGFFAFRVCVLICYVIFTVIYIL